MLGDLSFVIIREIIKRTANYKSIDNLILINKRFKSFIINDRVCQEHYLKIKYNLIIEKNHLELIKLLNSKSYSRYIGKGSVINKYFNIFVRPKDDNFIVEYKFYDKGSYRSFVFSENSMVPIISDILDKKIKNYEELLLSKGFYYLNADIRQRFFTLTCNYEFFLFNSRWYTWYNEIDKPQIHLDERRKDFDDFNSKILEVFDKLKN